MKNMKKFASILLALVLAMALTVPAFAADGDVQIKIKNTNENHTYGAFQIFTGTVADDETGEEKDGSLNGGVGTLSNIQWGANISETDRAALITELGLSAGVSASDVAYKLADQYKNNGAGLADFINDYISGSAASTATAPVDGVYTLNVQPGYYLVKDTQPVEGNDTATDFILEVVGAVEVTPKSTGTPTPGKVVLDTNDSTGTPEDAWSGSADHDVGDTVSYVLTAELPSNYDKYKTYKLQFVDEMDAGLTYTPGSAKVYIELNNEPGIQQDANESALASNLYTLTWENQVLTITFNDLMTSIPGLTAGSKIAVSYDAVLNDKAVFKNENDMHLVFSNDPNWDGDGTTEPPTGTTPKVTAVVFTYNPVVSKTNENNQPLAGARFQLLKWDDAANEWGTTPVQEKVIPNEASTSFTFKGIDDGIYKLVESQTPDGYNTVDDIIFAVVADHTVQDSTPVVKAATWNESTGVWAIGEEALTGFTFNVTQADIGEINTTVQNLPGALMPETGGIGTTIFYTLGGLMVVAAGVLLVTKRRMHSNG